MEVAVEVVKSPAKQMPAVTGETLTRLVSSGLTLDRRTWREEVRDSVSGTADRPD